MHRKTALALALTLALAAPAASAQTAVNTSPAAARVRYIVDDVPSAVAFYTDKLGFKTILAAGTAFAALSRGDLQLFLSPPKGPGGASQPMPNGVRPAPGGWNRIVLYTTDLQGDVDRLRKQGVHFRNDIVSGPGGREILLDDPSGNAVELFQPPG